jgi:glutathione synthase/RimK-type ligase-like ATP-grasp enzyme
MEGERLRKYMMTKPSSILFLCSSENVQANRIMDKLNNKGARCERINPDTFIKEFYLQVNISSGSCECDIHSRNEKFTNASLDLDNIRSVYCPFTYGFISDPTVSENEVTEFIQLENEAAIMGTLFSFLDNQYCTWVNHPLSSKLASHKIKQLFSAQKIGLKIPETLITNSTKLFKKFHDDKSDIICKAVNATPTYNPKRLIPTRIVDDHMLQFSSSIELTPVQFQECIDKMFDLRVNVIGHKVYATKIESSEIDGRLDIEKSKHSSYELPSDIQKKCIQLCREFGLYFGALDFVVSRDQKYYFLEVNPNGKWGWIEDKTGASLSEAFADLLMSHS